MSEESKYVRWVVHKPKVRDKLFKLSCMPRGVTEITEPIISQEKEDPWARQGQEDREQRLHDAWWQFAMTAEKYGCTYDFDLWPDFVFCDKLGSSRVFTRDGCVCCRFGAIVIGLPGAVWRAWADYKDALDSERR